MTRTKGILAAGTLTGLVLLTIVALGFNSLRAQAAEPAGSTTQSGVPLPDTSAMTQQEALQAWQEYTRELEQTVATLQERDAAYQAELEAANSTILDLQDSINTANSAPAYGDDDEYEYEEHEAYEDDDHDEYEEHEYEEHDDDDHGWFGDDD